MVQLSALDSFEEVMRTYQQSLDASGWEATESTMITRGLVITKFEKGRRVVSVMTMSVDGENSLISSQLKLDNPRRVLA